MLKQKLREDIKNSAGSVRYVDSALHLRHGYRIRKLNESPSRHNYTVSEVQSTTLDVGFNSPTRIQDDRKQQHQYDNIPSSSTIPSNSKSNTFQHLTATRDIASSSGDRMAQCGESTSGIRMDIDQTPSNSKHNRDLPSHSNNCQVCLIKGVTEDLRNIEKLVQERNEQISKLRARYLRSYFERQMMD